SRVSILHAVQYPGDFGSGKIGVQQQTGFFIYPLLAAFFLKFPAIFRRASVLPDNRGINRLAGGFIPDNNCFALIGYADAENTSGIIQLGQRVAAYFCGNLPDFLGVVFHPAICRIVLSKFLLCLDRKSTRLNSSHVKTSYAVFCLKKKSDIRASLEPGLV